GNRLDDSLRTGGALVGVLPRSVPQWPQTWRRHDIPGSGQSVASSPLSKEEKLCRRGRRRSGTGIHLITLFVPRHLDADHARIQTAPVLLDREVRLVAPPPRVRARRRRGGLLVVSQRLVRLAVERGPLASHVVPPRSAGRADLDV